MVLQSISRLEKNLSWQSVSANNGHCMHCGDLHGGGPGCLSFKTLYSTQGGAP